MTQKEKFFERVHFYFGLGEQDKADPLLLINKIEFDMFLKDINTILGLSVSKNELQNLYYKYNEEYTFEKLYDYFDSYSPNNSVEEIAVIDDNLPESSNKAFMAPKISSQSEAYNRMLQGQYDEAIQVLLNDSQLTEFNKFIQAINCDLHENKQHAEDIKDRNFFKRLISSNTKDIGEVLFEQNISLSAFYILLRLLSTSSQKDRKLLLNLYQYAEKEAKVVSNEQTSIQKGIIAILKKNEEDFKQNEIRDRALMKLLKEAQAIEDFKNGLSQLVSKIEQKHKEAERKLQEKYDKDIQSIKTDIKTQKDDINKKIDKTDLDNYIKTKVYTKDEVDQKIKYIWIAYGITTATLLTGLIASFLI